MQPIDPEALFRMSVLGPIISRKLQHGDLRQALHELAQREYNIPGSERRYLGYKTIEAWYYRWRLNGIDGLVQKERSDRGQSKISPEVQEYILQAKKDNPKRSLMQIQQLLAGVGTNNISRSAIHRLLQLHHLSRRVQTPVTDEKRSFEAPCAGDIWYGYVMHAIKIPVNGQMRKTYLVSLMDDASRLIAHSAFCLSETALDIEGVLKQALLKRGVPIKLVVDNGAAYRSKTLQKICARLNIHLVYCRPYAPEGKGKLERWHRTFRHQFLNELVVQHISSLQDLNARLWAWLEQTYHHAPHAGLSQQSPLARYQKDLPKIRQLGEKAHQLDDLFFHRVKRLVRKDGTVSYEGRFFEVAYELVGKNIMLIVDPHIQQVVGVEDEDGNNLGAVTPLDKIANSQRKRCRTDTEVTIQNKTMTDSLVEQAYNQYYNQEEK